MSDAPDERLKVTMRSVVLDSNGDTLTHEAIDYVGTDILDSYVELAQKNWQFVSVEAVDKLPASVINGGYTVPENLNVEAN